MKKLNHAVLPLLLAAFAFGTSFAASAPKTIYVGTQPDYPPFAYNDEKGVITGYDIEVVKAINKLLPEYKFEFVVGAWESIFLSLEANRTQIVADEIAKNPEREQKYLFSDEPYFRAESVIIVRKDRPKVSSLKDLEGLNVFATNGDSYTQLLEAYNAANGNKIKLKYSDSVPIPSIFQDIESGRIDAYVNDPVMSAAVIKESGFKNLRVVKDPVQFDNIHLVFRQDDQGRELKAKIDVALKKLKADGTLAQLSKKWTQDDYIPR
jgi:L-cystine transport system substrate-binding protein